MADDAWKTAFQIVESAQSLPFEQRHAFARQATSDPEILQLIFDVWAEESEAAGVDNLPRPGARIGRYEIAGKLAAGGMGQVYSARDLELDRMVALKFLSENFLALPGAVEQLIHEAKAASALNHANIVTVYEIVRSGEAAAIAMELVDGLSLREYCTAPQELSKVLDWARQIAAALAVAHGKGIVHGDIKPENIMIRGDNAAKVLDFGMARKTTVGSSAQSEFHHGGTLQYFSPEQARGERAMPPSDMFSLGTVLYELVTGRHPFAGASPLATLHSIGLDVPPSPSKANPAIPKTLDRLIQGMLAKEAHQRPTATAVAVALSQHLDHLRRRTQSRVLLLSLLTVSALAIVGLIWVRATHRQLSLRQVTLQLPDNRVTAGTISPDGKRLAYATVDGVFLQNMENGETHLLRSPPKFWVNRIRWYRDGSGLLVGGVTQRSSRPAIWIVSQTGAEPKLFRKDASDPEISTDSRMVAFTDSTSSEIWVSDLEGNSSRQILRSPGRMLLILYWSPDSTHLALAHRRSSDATDATSETGRFGIYGESLQFESINVATEKIDVELAQPDIRSACVFPDSHILFLGPYATDHASGSDLWQVGIDRHTGKPLGRPRRMPLKPDWIQDIAASTDGHVATVVHLRSAPTVYVGDYSAGDPAIRNIRHLTLDASSSYPHSWSADSRGNFYESDRRGNNDLFRQDIDSRFAESIVASPLEDFQANLAPGGNSILYIQSPLHEMLPASIFRVSVNGGRVEQVVASGRVDEFRCPSPQGKRCVARTTEGHDTFTFWQLDAQQGLGRKLARVRWEPNVYGDWALSPDGNEVAIPSHPFGKSRIRLVALDDAGGSTEREVAVETPVNLRGLNFTADGKGWFGTLVLSGGSKLAYIDRSGRVTTLLEPANYAFPSPDGKRVALAIPAVTSNIWAVDGL